MASSSLAASSPSASASAPSSASAPVASQNPPACELTSHLESIRMETSATDAGNATTTATATVSVSGSVSVSSPVDPGASNSPELDSLDRALFQSAVESSTNESVSTATNEPGGSAPVSPPPIPTQELASLITPTTASVATATPHDKANELRVTPEPKPERCQLEDFTPFSRCHLWKLMSSFYDRQGVESWAQGIVPHFITSNTFIAKKYTRLLMAYIRDARRKEALDMSEPLYIVELGAGSGKFSFYFLKALAEIEQTLEFPLNNIRYIMTDFTTQNFNFWKSHDALAPFVARGIVDFAIFDATKDTKLELFLAKTTISAGQLKNPLCVVANYLFDTLHHDLFQVDRGVLKEGLISVGSKRLEEPDPLDPEIIKRLFNVFRYDVIGKDYYSNEHFNRILRWYQQYFSHNFEAHGATILVPIGALEALERLSALSDNRLVVFSGDKGNSHPEHFIGLSDPHIAVHGSFSVMVNYHALGVYFASRGGFALHTPQEEASLKVSVFVLNPDRSQQSCQDEIMDQLDQLFEKRSRQDFGLLRMTFEDEISSFGPNDFFILQKSVKEDSKVPSLKSVLAVLKLSGWDPDVFYKFRDVLLDQSPGCAPKLRKDVKYGIPFVWKNYYALDKEKDIAFEIGRLYYGINDYDSALAFYTLSTQEMGKHHVTSHNMGLCYYSKKQLDLASKFFEEAYKLNPNYQKAATWMQRVNRELGILPANGSNGTGRTSDELLVQEIELVMSEHEEEKAVRAPITPTLQQLSIDDPNNPNYAPTNSQVHQTPVTPTASSNL